MAQIDHGVISTPCVGVCRAPDGVCVGCGRTVSEIAAWRRLNEAERVRIMRDELPSRLMQPASERSGMPHQATADGKNVL